MATGYSTGKQGKSWRARVRYKGVSCQRSFQRKTAADAWARQQVRDIDDGVFNKQERRYQNMTLVDALNEYIETLEIGSSKHTDYGFHKRILEQHKIGRKTLAQIGVNDLAEFIGQRKKKDISGNTIRNNLNGISRIFTFGNSDWGLGLVNPVSLLDKDVKPKKNRPRERRLQEGEFEILYEEAKRTNYNFLCHLIKFQTNSGFRLGEASRIPPDGGQIKKERLVYLQGTKLGNDRFAPLTNQAYEALMEYRPHWGSEQIWPESTSLSTAFYEFKTRMLKKGAIKENITMHDLRHESLSRLFELYDPNGNSPLNLPDILHISGHEDIQTLLKTYVNVPVSATAKKLRDFS
tara:strand:- start:1596 stop:2645 length:1050 start_codon:yes stop_codon:yes gene_type:complete